MSVPVRPSSCPTCAALILPRDEWVRFFGVLCRDDGLDDIYNAEEKLQLHDEALRARLAEAVELLNRGEQIADALLCSCPVRDADEWMYAARVFIEEQTG